MLTAGTSVSTKNRQSKTTDSREVQYLHAILDAINTLNGSLHNVFTSAPAVFTVGTTNGAPTNATSAWTISTINVIGKTPVFLKGGVLLVSGTDYTFNNSTGIMTLAVGTFATNEVYTVLY